MSIYKGDGRIPDPPIELGDFAAYRVPIDDVLPLKRLVERLGEALEREPGEGRDYEGARAAYRAWLFENEER